MASPGAADRQPSGRRRSAGVQARALFGEVEVAALIFYIQRHLPSMLAAGGRPGSGYVLGERQQRWGRVRRLVRARSGVRRTTQQLMHRWADIIDREQDLLDLLGVEVPGLAPKGRRRTGGDGGEAQTSSANVAEPAQPNNTEAGASAAEGGGIVEEGEAAAATATATPAQRPSRQEIAVRLRRQRLQRILEEYRRLVDMEYESTQPTPDAGAPPQPDSAPQQVQRRRRRRRRGHHHRQAAAASTSSRLEDIHRLLLRMMQRITRLERAVNASRRRRNHL